MMTFLLTPFLAASAAVSEPDLGALVTYRDYPSSALREDAQAAVYIEVEFAANGRVTACKRLGFVGSQSLADQICQIVKKRRVRPARLQDGTASPARLRTMVRMTLPDTAGAVEIENAVQPADLELTVNTLPDSAKLLDTSIVMAIDVEGKAVACSAARYARNVSLVDVACQYAITLKFATMVKSDGTPEAYVTMQRVRFRVDSASGALFIPPAAPQPAA